MSEQRHARARFGGNRDSAIGHFGRLSCAAPALAITMDSVSGLWRRMDGHGSPEENFTPRNCGAVARDRVGISMAQAAPTAANFRTIQDAPPSTQLRHSVGRATGWGGQGGTLRLANFDRHLLLLFRPHDSQIKMVNSFLYAIKIVNKFNSHS
jgi:hypothetical protein